MAPKKRQPWHNREFGDRVERHQARHREAGIEHPELHGSKGTRARDGESTLPELLSVAKALFMALPPGVLRDEQNRLLAALEKLVEATEQQYGVGARTVRARIEALVSMVEDEVDKTVGGAGEKDRPLGRSA